MPQGVMSDLSSRRGAAARQCRWRRRVAAKRRVAEGLRQRLISDPTPAEMRAEVKVELAKLGLAPGPVDVDRRTGVPTGTFEDSPRAKPPDDGGDDDHNRDNAPSSTRAISEPRRLAERRSPPADLAQAGNTNVGRGVALAGLSFELRVAEQRDRIFDLLMAGAERGDVSCLLHLSSRLSPPARTRRTIHVPEILALDLGTSECTQKAIEVALRKVAAGEL